MGRDIIAPATIFETDASRDQVIRHLDEFLKSRNTVLSLSEPQFKILKHIVINSGHAVNNLKQLVLTFLCNQYVREGVQFKQLQVSEVVCFRHKGTLLIATLCLNGALKRCHVMKHSDVAG